MPSTQTDRLLGLTTSVAVKAPVKAVSIANLTLSGEQTVNGVAVVDGDRVLVKDQTTASENGIYVVSTGAWARSKDFDGANDVRKGTLIVSNTGTTIYYRVTTADPITIGTSNLTFEAVSGAVTQDIVGVALFPRSTQEIAAGVTPTNYYRPYGDPRRYGAAIDADGLGGGTDDTTALINWGLVPGYKFGIPGIAKVTGQITFVADANGIVDVDLNGMRIDGSTGVTWTNNAVAYVAGSLTQIPDLSVSPSKGAVSLTFGSAHTLDDGAVGIIYNPTNSSWSTKQTYYRAGEFFKVAIDTSTTVVKLYGGLWAGYTAANVDVYKMTPCRVSIRNGTFIAPNSGSISPIKIVLATQVRMRNITGLGSNYVGINLDRCYDVDIDGCAVEVPVQVAASKYGISVGNSQHVRIRGCHLESVRHAVNIGGDDLTGVVPCRDVRISDSYLANDAALSNVQAASCHGNAEDVWYENCTIFGGGEFGGRDIHYVGCDFRDYNYATGAVILGGSEWLGGVAEVRDCTIFGSLAYSQGIIRLSTDANVNSDSTLIVEGIHCEQSLCDTFARCDLTASTYKVNATIRNITFRNSTSLAQICRMVGTGAAGAGDFVVVDNIENAPSGAALLTQVSGYTASRKKLMQQMGAIAVTPVSGAATATAAGTFRYAYGSGITPNIVVSCDTDAVNSKTTVASITSAASTGFTAKIRTADSANFGATSPVVNVQYVAGVSE